MVDFRAASSLAVWSGMPSSLAAAAHEAAEVIGQVHLHSSAPRVGVLVAAVMGLGYFAVLGFRML
jgi:hypothetical protein